MTNFGKSLSIGLVVIIIALVIVFVSRKPDVEVAPETPSQATVQTTGQSEATTDTSDQSLDQDMTTVDAQMQGLNADTTAATQAE